VGEPTRRGQGPQASHCQLSKARTVPLLDSVEGFYTEEWHRFMQGLYNLTPRGQEDARLRAYQYGRIPGAPRTANIPGWDSVIAVKVHAPVTHEDYVEYYTAIREGREPNLSTDVRDSIVYRNDVTDRIRNSTAEPYNQALGQVYQAINAVQRSLVEAAVVGRLVMWPTLAALKAIAPPLTQLEALEALGIPVGATLSAAELTAVRRLELGIAGRIAAGLVPGIGWILTAAQVLTWLFWLGQTALPLYALLCRSPLEALAALAAGFASGGIPANRITAQHAFPGNALKGRVWEMAGVNPFSTEMRALAERKALRWIPSIHEGIKGFHLAHEGFGRGLAFGGIMGMYTELAYAGALRLSGEPVNVAAPEGWLGAVGVQAGWYALERGSLPLAAFAAGTYLFDRLGRYTRAELRAKQDAARILQQGPFLNGIQDLFTEQEHAQFLVAYAYSLDLVYEDFYEAPWDELLDAYARGPFQVTLAGDAGDALLQNAKQVPVRSYQVWPTPGNPEFITADAYVGFAQAAVPRFVENLLRPRAEDVSGMFFGAVIRHITDRLYKLYLGPGGDVATRFTPDWRVMSSLAKEGKIPIVGPQNDKIWSFWQEARGIASGDGPSGFTPDELDQLLRKHGVLYVQLT
jgi:hypothetical protein